MMTLILIVASVLVGVWIANVQQAEAYRKRVENGIDQLEAE